MHKQRQSPTLQEAPKPQQPRAYRVSDPLSRSQTSDFGTTRNSNASAPTLPRSPSPQDQLSDSVQFSGLRRSGSFARWGATIVPTPVKPEPQRALPAGTATGTSKVRFSIGEIPPRPFSSSSSSDGGGSAGNASGVYGLQAPASPLLTHPDSQHRRRLSLVAQLHEDQTRTNDAYASNNSNWQAQSQARGSAGHRPTSAKEVSWEFAVSPS